MTHLGDSMTNKASYKHRFLSIKYLVCAAVLSGCAQNSYLGKQQPDISDKPEPEAPGYQLVNNTYFSNIAASSTLADKGHAAILAMQGEYKVDFDFNETVVLQPGYERHAAKNSGAFEVVMVIEDSPKKVVLQHILVVGNGHVVKHWRQDWVYEARERFEFIADQTWAVKSVADDKQEGQWTQCVYEVSDAPRYCGTGSWNHHYGVSTWTSDRTWRPLPRREYTVRDDYNALNVENRHTVTAQGWTHEQDNTKTVRDGTKTQATIVREFGFNNYRRIDGYNFSPGYEYWQKTAEYWAEVRAAWAERFNSNKQIVLKTEVDGMPIIAAIFSQAESIGQVMERPTTADIDKVLDQWVTAAVD